jgi:biopolymer transport protein ExbD
MRTVVNVMCETSLFVLLVACGQNAPSSVDCELAGDGVRAYWTKQITLLRNDAKRNYARAMAEMTPARLVRHCKADGWSSQAVECARTANEPCIDLLTPAQQEKLRMDPEDEALTKQEPLDLPTPPRVLPPIACELDPLAMKIAHEGVWIGARSKTSCLRSRVQGALDAGRIESELRRVAVHAGGCAVPIELTAIGHVPYEEIILVMDVAARTGLPDVGLASPNELSVSFAGEASKPAIAADCPLPGGRHEIAPTQRPKEPPRGNKPADHAPVVIITTEAILHGGKTVASITQATRGSGVIAELERELPPHPADPAIILEADRSTDSAVIMRVIETTKHAGYDKLLFVVKQE